MFSNFRVYRRMHISNLICPKSVLCRRLIKKLEHKRCFNSSHSVFQNHYETLGVSQQASQAEIKKAYHKQLKEHHPDVSKGADTTDKTVRIMAAYQVLSNRIQKEEYDRLLKYGTTFNPGLNEYHQYQQTQSSYKSASGQSNKEPYGQYSSYKSTYGQRSNRERYGQYSYDEYNEQFYRNQSGYQQDAFQKIILLSASLTFLSLSIGFYAMHRIRKKHTGDFEETMVIFGDQLERHRYAKPQGHTSEHRRRDRSEFYDTRFGNSSAMALKQVGSASDRGRTVTVTPTPANLKQNSLDSDKNTKTSSKQQDSTSTEAVNVSSSVKQGASKKPPPPPPYKNRQVELSARDKEIFSLESDIWQPGENRFGPTKPHIHVYTQRRLPAHDHIRHPNEKTQETSQRREREQLARQSNDPRAVDQAYWDKYDKLATSERRREFVQRELHRQGLLTGAPAKNMERKKEMEKARKELYKGYTDKRFIEKHSRNSIENLERRIEETKANNRPYKQATGDRSDHHQ